MNRAIFAMAAGAMALSACTTTSQTASAPTAPAAPAGAQVLSASLRTGTNAPVGTVTATAATDGVVMTIEAMNMPQGTHGVHVHTVGKCDAPDFTTAGGHWNPAGRQHGLDNPAGSHAGDLPNLLIGADGKGTLNYTVRGATLAAMMDADGSAFVVHAGPDDMKTDPSGNSGGRIACGVFAEG
ncbi:superoxide dismutase family protein [Sphingomonas sp. BGYR3]|uniref:superoxide dismutase family protein n=1 Tax=Sphingomonas sp. BGYR3 TaxID=2975483 RepID=UPI0021A96E03|nr:superoxide dismutase family protein [Sphingomonas sp. BGYR3]MDG5487954.1 superoxide dismutase family protein [Sphingomonas sp. BGYR3]